MGVIKFENQFVAFLDVLGFSNKVLTKDIKTLELYFSTIEECLNQVKELRKDFKHISISDSIIISAENKENNFKRLLAVIVFIQAKLSIQGIWLRGGLTFGEMYFDSEKNVVVGKALIEAINLEKQAIYPRVILSPKIVSMISDGNYRNFISHCNNGKEGSKLIHDYNTSVEYRITQNDSIFVSYAHFLISESLKSEEEFVNSKLMQALKSIKESLFSEQAHYLKYKWLKDFFQESIMEFKTPITKATIEGKTTAREKFLKDASIYLGTLG